MSFSDKNVDFDDLLDCAIELSGQNNDPDYISGLIDLIEGVLPLNTETGVKVVLKKLLDSNSL